jgi:hypothetical protein
MMALRYWQLAAYPIATGNGGIPVIGSEMFTLQQATDNKFVEK